MIEVKNGFIKLKVRSYSEGDMRSYYKEEMQALESEEGVQDVIPVRSRFHIVIPYYIPISRLSNIEAVSPVVEDSGDNLVAVKATSITFKESILEVEHPVEEVMNVIYKWLI